MPGQVAVALHLEQQLVDCIAVTATRRGHDLADVHPLVAGGAVRLDIAERCEEP
jgi:hypothetical protein